MIHGFRAKNVEFEFTIVDFQLMNLNDLIIVSNILCDVDTSQVPEENRNAFGIGYAHIKVSWIDTILIWQKLTLILPQQSTIHQKFEKHW